VTVTFFKHPALLGIPGDWQVAQPDSDDLEDQEFLSLDKDELKNALRAGEFKVITWSAVVALALQVLNTRGPAAK
jgi:hypothetical protein